MKFIKLSFCFVVCFACNRSGVRELADKSPAPQPYSYIKAKNTGIAIPFSPDPIVGWRWDTPGADDELEIYTLRPVRVWTDRPGSFRNLNSVVQSAARIDVTGTGDITFDFGQVNAAWLEFDSKDMDGLVEMSISEYNEPAILNTGAQNRIKTKTPVKYGNTYRLELNDELYEGVRYGWIHVRSFTKEWHIDNVRLVCQIKPVNYKGSFSCSDSLLTKIWYTGAYGVKLNLLKDYFGAILMERSDRFAWTGDAHPSQAAALAAFANYDFIRKSIEHTADQNNGILSYSLYWVLSLADYFHYTGDTLALMKYVDNASRKLDLANQHFGTDPPLGFYGWDERIGAGFENPGCRESQNAYKMLTIRSWIVFAKALESIGKNDLGEKYRNYASERMKEVRKDPVWYKNFGVHAAADAINTGMLTSAEQDSLFRNVFRDRLNRLSYSPFNQYFIIQALTGIGRFDEAVETVRDCWGGQINYGGTAFFEVYRPSWNQVLSFNDAPPNNQCGYTSLAHPWGSGVVKWLSEEVLGIMPVFPGFKTAEIKPHLGRTLTNVKGGMPTPYGTIQAEFDVAKGTARVVIPDGIRATIAIPKVEKEINSIGLNGTKVWHKGQGRSLNNPVTEDDDYIYFYNMGGGNYTFEIEYLGQTPVYHSSEWMYPAVFVGVDRVTAGNWNKKYGSKGVVFFNYQKKNGKAMNYSSLPGYIRRVTTRLNADTIWNVDTRDERAICPVSESHMPRSIGAILTRDPEPTKQTMTIDIEFNKENDQEITLYFVDWDKKNRRTAVEMFDLETRQMVSPVKIVRQYQQGNYLTYRYNRSVRFRINHIRGPNAVLSAIFFDDAK
jgi:alpha-L-rhamnosidase